MEPVDHVSKSVTEPAAERDAPRTAHGPPARTPDLPLRRFKRSGNALPTRPRPGIRRGALEQLDPIHEGELGADARERDALHRRLLAAADLLSAGLAMVVAIVAGAGTPTFVVVLAVPLIVLVSKLLRLYDRDEHVLHKSTLDEAPAILNVAIVFMMVAWLLDNELSTEWLNKAQLLLMAVLLIVFMGVTRTLARRIAVGRAAAERLLVLGSGEECARIDEKLSRVHPLKAEVVGRVPLTHEPHGGRGEDVLGILPELDFVLRAHRVDRVVLCPPGELSSEMLDTIRLVKELGVKVSVVPRLFEVVGSSVEFDELGGLTLLGLRRYDLAKSSAFLKRALDVTGATVGLVLLAPLLITIAVAIKVTSPGPVFFRQRRIGRGGEPFQMLKFRTMYDGADGKKADLLHRNEASDGFFKIAEDPRVTPIGRWLRRTSLDEMPQLFHVLRGEMSLVGPRPLVSEEDARIEGWFRRRLDVTPGMTGAWQVLGSSRIPMRDMVTIDYLYRANWSLWLDVKILLRTVPHMLSRRGL